MRSALLVDYDVIIIGGGPAGLSAALVLGRCRRNILLIDAGHPRNQRAAAMHGFLSRDGIHPLELLRLGREQTAGYGVRHIADKVTAARCVTPGGSIPAATTFEVTLSDGRVFRARKVLLATGVTDILPPVEGIERFYGRSVHHCPYCDAYEHRDQPLAAYGHGDKAVGLALALRTWSARVTACTDGHAVERQAVQRLERNGIALRAEPIARLEGDGDRLQRIVFTSGEPLACSAMFFNTDQVQRSPLASQLGCERDEADHVITSPRQRTQQPGLFLAGDADGDVQFAIVAAAEGATAAVAINRELQDEDRQEPGPHGFAPKS